MAEKRTTNRTNGTTRKTNTSANRTRSNSRRNIDLEMTNGFDITFDDDRLTDTESLDVSFIEGKKKKAPKIEISSSKINEEENYQYDDSSKKKYGEVIVTILIVVASYVLGFLNCYILIYHNHIKIDGINVKEVEKIKTEVVIDDNYLFLGDSITEFYDLDEFYGDLPVINSGVSGYKTTDILSKMNEMVYQYNPSKVFLLIGTNDLNHDVELEDVVSNIEKIVTSIKENRPYAEIYLEAIYPINDSDDAKIDHDMVGKRSNENIVKVNESLKQLAEDKKITYIDTYSLLLDDNGDLKVEYTVEGLHISDEGYEVITEELKKYINQ